MPTPFHLIARPSDCSPNFWRRISRWAPNWRPAKSFDEANREFAEAVRLQPGDPRAHFDKLGVLLANQGVGFDEALQELKESIRFLWIRATSRRRTISTGLKVWKQRQSK